MSHEHDIVLLPLSGDLCVRTAPVLRDALDGFLQEGRKRIVINMADVNYVDSAGMSVLIATMRRMREQGGLLSLVNVTPDVLRTLKISRIVDLILGMDNPIHVQVLYGRYVKGRSLSAIANELAYSYDRIKHVHGEALQAFDEKYLRRES